MIVPLLPRDVSPDLVDGVVLLGLGKIKWKGELWTDVLLPNDSWNVFQLGGKLGAEGNLQ